MGIVVALDAGTTGIRALALDEGGRPVGWSYRELPQHLPRPGWVEHDAEEIWATTVAVLDELLGAVPGPVAALGIANQRETVVAWDRRTGRPLHRALVWQDRRTAARCEVLEAQGHLPLVRAATGLVLDPYFSATKMAWLLEEGGVPAAPDLALGTVDAWLLWRLTGGAVFATDATNASRTLLFDIGRLAWSDELCALFGVPLRALPEVRASSGRFGTTVAVGALPAGLPITGVAGDQQAALFGQACVRPGMTKSTYGTGSFVLMNVGDRCPSPVEGLLTTVAWTLDGTPGATYAFEGSAFTTGAAVRWLRDGLGLIATSDESEALARGVATSAGVYVVPAFAGLGSPWWDPRARGTIVGLTLGTTGAHLTRAVLEAIAFQTRDVVDAMTATAGHGVDVLRVDGGAAANRLLLEIQADQLQVPVQRPAAAETTAMGAAYLAGLGAGLWADVDEVAARWALDLEVRPSTGAADADRAHAGWRRAVERALRWEEA